MSIFECLICCEQLIDPSFTPSHAASLCRALDLYHHSKKSTNVNNQRFKEESVEDELDFDFEELVQGGTYCPKCVTRIQDLTVTFQQLEELQRKVNFVGESIREELTRSYQLNCEMMEEGWTQNQEIREKIISKLNGNQNPRNEVESESFVQEIYSPGFEIPDPLESQGQIQTQDDPEMILGSNFDDDENDDPSPPSPLHSCSSEISFEEEKFNPTLDLGLHLNKTSTSSQSIATPSSKSQIESTMEEKARVSDRNRTSVPPLKTTTNPVGGDLHLQTCTVKLRKLQVKTNTKSMTPGDNVPQPITEKQTLTRSRKRKAESVSVSRSSTINYNENSSSSSSEDEESTQTPTTSKQILKSCLDEVGLRPFTIKKSTRGNDLVIVDSFTYMKHRKQYWRCTEINKNGCKARVTVLNSSQVLSNNIPHCHDPPAEEVPSKRSRRSVNPIPALPSTSSNSKSKSSYSCERRTFEVIKSHQGNDLIVLDSYTFGSGGDKKRQYWRCTHARHGCKVKAKSVSENQVVTNEFEHKHNHEPVTDRIQRLQVMNLAKTFALESSSTDVPTTSIVNQLSSTVIENETLNADIADPKSAARRNLMRAINRSRRGANLTTPANKSKPKSSYVGERRTFEMIKSHQGSDLIALDSYLFGGDKRGSYWRCTHGKNGCPVRVKSVSETEVITNGFEHNHEPVNDRIQHLQVRNVAKTFALEQSSSDVPVPTTSIVNQLSSLGIANETLNMENPKSKARINLMRAINHVRKSAKLAKMTPAKRIQLQLRLKSKPKTSYSGERRPFQIIKSHKGTDLLVLDSYLFGCDRTQLYWKCTHGKNGCKVRAKLVNETEVVTNGIQHNHAPVNERIQSLQVMNFAKIYALESSSSDVPTSTIVNELSSLGIANGTQYVNPNSVARKSLVRAINNVRRGVNKLTTTATTNVKPPKRKPPDMTRISCTYPECGYTRRKNQTLEMKAHILKFHEGIDECFICENCNISFTTKVDLQTHIQLHKEVSEELLFPCAHCSLSFETDFKRREHLSNIHAKHRCPKCNLGFISNVRFQMHLESHDKPKPTFMCEICSLSMTTLTGFRNHQRNQHPPGNTPRKTYPCEECGKNFLSRKNLEDHVKLVHRKEYNLTCEICGWGCLKKSRLNEHMIVAHLDVKNFLCFECGDRFKTKTALVRHQRKHTGETPYKCRKCSQAFGTASNRIRHEVKCSSNSLCS